MHHPATLKLSNLKHCLPASQEYRLPPNFKIGAVDDFPTGIEDIGKNAVISVKEAKGKNKQESFIVSKVLIIIDRRVYRSIETKTFPSAPE